jgi:hypothetical protein
MDYVPVFVKHALSAPRRRAASPLPFHLHVCPKAPDPSSQPTPTKCCRRGPVRICMAKTAVGPEMRKSSRNTIPRHLLRVQSPLELVTCIIHELRSLILLPAIITPRMDVCDAKLRLRSRVRQRRTALHPVFAVTFHCRRRKQSKLLLSLPSLSGRRQTSCPAMSARWSGRRALNSGIGQLRAASPLLLHRLVVQRKSSAHVNWPRWYFDTMTTFDSTCF